MKWLQPYIIDTVQRIETSSDALWDFFLEKAKGDLSDFRGHQNSFGKSAFYANIALGLSMPEISDAVSENMGASSPKSPTGKEEMMKREGFFAELGMALDVSDRIIAEWDIGAKAAGGYDQGATQTHKNVLRLVETVRAGPPKPRQEVMPEMEVMPEINIPPQQSLLTPEA